MSIRRIQFKVFSPDNRTFFRKQLQAPPRRAFNADGVEQSIRRMADVVEKQFPNFDYRLVPTGPSSFNFVCEGLRPTE